MENIKVEPVFVNKLRHSMSKFDTVAELLDTFTKRWKREIFSFGRLFSEFSEK
jgi:hypothetical protein